MMQQTKEGEPVTASKIVRFCVVCGWDDADTPSPADGAWLRVDAHTPTGLCGGCQKFQRDWDGGIHILGDQARAKAFAAAVKLLDRHGLTLYRQVDDNGEERGAEPELFNYSFESAMPRARMKESGVTRVDEVKALDENLDTGSLELHFFNNTREALWFLRTRSDEGPEHFLNFDLLAESPQGVVLGFVHFTERPDRVPALVVDHGNLIQAASEPPSLGAQIRVLEENRESLEASYVIQAGRRRGRIPSPGWRRSFGAWTPRYSTCPGWTGANHEPGIVRLRELRLLRELAAR
jgi:hypothetical protein